MNILANVLNTDNYICVHIDTELSNIINKLSNECKLEHNRTYVKYKIDKSLIFPILTDNLSDSYKKILNGDMNYMFVSDLFVATYYNPDTKYTDAYISVDSTYFWFTIFINDEFFETVPIINTLN